MAFLLFCFVKCSFVFICGFDLKFVTANEAEGQRSGPKRRPACLARGE
jgi:hypothetical protein